MMNFLKTLINGHKDISRSELIDIVSRDIRENFMHISGDERNQTGKPGGALPIGSSRVKISKYGDEARILLSDIRAMRADDLMSSFDDYPFRVNGVRAEAVNEDVFEVMVRFDMNPHDSPEIS